MEWAGNYKSSAHLLPLSFKNIAMRKLLFLIVLFLLGTCGIVHAQCEGGIVLGMEVQPICEGEAGAVHLSISGGTPPYLINQSLSTTGDTTLSELASGIYTLQLQDAADCVLDTSFAIQVFEIQNININDASTTCLGGFSATIEGGAYGVEILDEDGTVRSTSLPANGFSEGRYRLRVFNEYCTLEQDILIGETAPLSIEVDNIIHATEACGTTGGNFDLSVTGGNTPYRYDWPFPIVPPLSPGDYSITIIDVGGCTDSVTVTILSEGDCTARTLGGEIILDANENCVAETTELNIPFLPIRLELVKDSIRDTDKIVVPAAQTNYIEGVRYEQVNSIQDYRLDIELERPWQSDYKYIKLSTQRANACRTQHYFAIADLLAANNITPDFQFLIDPTLACPMLMVDIAAARLRRGFVNTYHVQYCNYGNVDAADAYIDITLDENVSFQSSTVADEFLGNRQYRFQLGDLEANDCGRFTIDVLVDATSELGQTHCTEAHIYPNAPCTTSPEWSGAEISVDVRCEDDQVIFGIENIGDGEVEDVPFSIVTEEIIMLPPPEIDLSIENRVEYAFPANGATYRMEVGQTTGFPFPSRPSASIEGCGTNENGLFSKGIINLFALDDYEPYKAIDCQENRAAYDPNDKQGFPIGIGTKHIIEPNTDIEYKIRFQNTGTDTAFNVVILDTLATHLDWESVAAGASSHDYEFDKLAANVLRFQFRNILLPDSTTNEAASHGFINFRVRQRNDIPLGTVIGNTTAIYFDYNEAIFTNTTHHTIDINFLEIFSPIDDDAFSNIKISAYPNPFSAWTQFKVTGFQATTPLQLELYDILGKRVYSTTMENNQLLLHRPDLTSGMYLYKVRDQAKIIGTGKLIIARE